VTADWPAKEVRLPENAAEFDRLFDDYAAGKVADEAFAAKLDLDEDAPRRYVICLLNAPQADPVRLAVLDSLPATHGARGNSFLVGIYHLLDIRGRSRVIRLFSRFDYFESWRMLVALLGRAETVPGTIGVGEAGAGERKELRICDLAANELLEKLRAEPGLSESLSGARPITPDMAAEARGAEIALIGRSWEAGQDAIHGRKASFMEELVKAGLAEQERVNNGQAGYDAAFRSDIDPAKSPEDKARQWEQYLKDHRDKGYKVDVAEYRAAYWRNWRPRDKGDGGGGGQLATIKLDLGGGVEMTLAWVKPGRFRMGKDLEDMFKSHKVEITKGFYISATEVTKEQWMAVMGTRPWLGSMFAEKDADSPAQKMTWDEAVEFCWRLGAKTGRLIRLPTEAEWEYACRAGSKGDFCFGDSEKRLDDYAWTNSRDPDQPVFHPVARKKPNAWGLYDMHGNVREWCWDWRDDTWPETIPDAVDPTGPQSGTRRAVRGGSTWSERGDMASWVPAWEQPENRADDIGFRIACEGGLVASASPPSRTWGYVIPAALAACILTVLYIRRRRKHAAGRPTASRGCQ